MKPASSSCCWDNRAEWSLSLFDIERKNVYAAQGGMQLNVAGSEDSKGVEISAAIRPTPEWKLWGNLAYVEARYADYDFVGGSFSGNTPPNVPRVVANAGASYRFATAWPVELGASVRHVGDRFNTDANTVTMLAYTVADAFAFVDIGKTRVTFRVRNLAEQDLRDLGRSVLPRPDPARRAAQLRGVRRIQVVRPKILKGLKMPA